MRILVVDDEPTVVETVTNRLQREGFETVAAGSAEDGIRRVKEDSPDLIVLDIGLPNRSGLAMCRAVRQQSNVPIIFLTALGTEQNKVAGFEAGGDDYLTKPFSLAELVARIRSIMRRSQSTPSGQILESGNIQIDASTHTFRIDNQIVEISPKEFALLMFFVQHRGQVFTRDTLLDRVWGQDAYVSNRTVDVHVRWLRERIEENPAKPTRLVTVRGVGYKFLG